MLSLTGKAIEGSKRELRAIANQLIENEISLKDWQKATAQQLKILHLQQALLGRGGVDAMKSADYLAIGRNLKSEYEYLRNFAKDINDGNLTQSQFLARLDMYAEKSRSSGLMMAEAGHKEQGYQYMQRFLAPANNCQSCIEYAFKGIQPIGFLPLPTFDCFCRANCRCSVMYFRKPDGSD
ncbi:hypothetical protein [Floridanema evergladense]